MKKLPNTKKKPPSRVKYETEHPTVSLRVPRDLYDKLRAVREAEGTSITDVLKVGVGLLEVKVRRERKIREEAYLAGRLKGSVDAKEKYSVSYPCSVCGEPIVVDSTEEKEFIKRKMSEYGWGHSECLHGRR
jgi:hypothetical protein